MNATKKSLTVLGCHVNVIIRTIEDERFECVFDPQRNDGDIRRDLMGAGRGATQEEAIAAFVASCHRREELPPGTLYERDSAMAGYRE